MVCRAPCCLGQLHQVGRLNGGSGAVAVQLLLEVVGCAEREARPDVYTLLASSLLTSMSSLFSVKFVLDAEGRLEVLVRLVPLLIEVHVIPLPNSTPDVCTSGLSRHLGLDLL